VFDFELREIQLRLAAGEQTNASALGGKPKGQALSDAAAGACDDRDLAVEPSLRHCSPFT
jgi:hypothetical protein